MLNRLSILNTKIILLVFITMGQASGATVTSFKENVVHLRKSSGESLSRGDKVCIKNNDSNALSCGEITKNFARSAKARFKNTRGLKRGQRARKPVIVSNSRQSISCQPPKIQMVIPTRSFVRINQGSRCGIAYGQKLCFYGNNRLLSCGKVTLVGSDAANVAIPARKVKKLQIGHIAKASSNTQLSRPKEKASKGDFGESFFNINQGMASILKKDKKEKIKEKHVYFGGYFKEGLAYGDYTANGERLSDEYQRRRDFKKIRSTLNLGLDLNFSKTLKARFEVNGWYDYVYQYRGKENFENATIKAYETDLDIRDGYFEQTISPKLSVKVGRQIIAWGESDFSQIADIPNPRDQLEVGLVDVEDSRLSVFASKISHVKKQSETNLVLVHEMRGNRLPAEGSDFDPFGDARDVIVFEGPKKQRDSLENTEIFLRYKRIFNGGQIALVAGEHFDDDAHLTLSQFESDGEVTLTTAHLTYKRIRTLAAAANKTSGSTLYKAETGINLGRSLSRKDVLEQINSDPSGQSLVITESKNTLEGMIGLEYSGITDLMIVVEAVNERVLDHKETLFQNRDEGRLNTLLSYEIDEGQTEFDLSWTHLNRGEGEVYRLSATFDIMDNLEMDLGYLDFEFTEEASTLQKYNDQDRYFANLKLSF